LLPTPSAGLPLAAAAPVTAAGRGSGYVLKTTLPASPASASVYRVASKPRAADVQRLATALHVADRITVVSGGWQVGDRFSVTSSGRWQYGGLCPPSTLAGCPVASGGGIGYATGGVVSSGTNTSTSLSTPAVVGSGVIAPMPPISAPPLRGAPTPTGPVPPSLSAPPAVPVTSDTVARSAAAPVLSAVGLSDAVVSVSYGQVSADPVFDNLRTVGYATTLSVAHDGSLTAGFGWFPAAQRGISYPLITAAAALHQLPPRPEPMFACRIVPGQPTGCPSFPPAAVTHVHLGLTLTADGAGPMLVPAWLFTISNDPEPTPVIAVQPRYLGPPPAATPPTTIPPGPPTLPGKMPPSPTTNTPGPPAASRPSQTAK
jgi:hypothetical protein